MSAQADIITRLLHDAESAGRRGHGKMALDLLVAAMDLAPGDTAVITRAQLIHAGLKASAAPVTATKARAPLPSPRLRSPFGSVDGLSGPVETPPVSVPAGPLAHTAQGLQEASASSRGKPRPSPQRAAGVVALWAMGLLAALLLAFAWSRPDFVDDARAWFGEPMVRAERAYQAGQLEEAMEYARRVRGERESKAVLLMGRIELESGRPEEAREYANAALSVDQAWATADAASAILLSAGDTSAAAVAARMAFERGAPAERWLDITLTQIRAGNVDIARNYLVLAARSPVYSSGEGLERLNEVRDSLLAGGAAAR